MTGLLRAFRDAVAGREPATLPWPKPRGCDRCGCCFSSESAWDVHFESGPGSRCLPESRFDLLTQIDGVWALRGSDAARK